MSRRAGWFGILLMACSTTAFAQTPAARPRFEVAVVKPLTLDKRAQADPNFSIGMKVTAQQVTIRLPLEAMIEIAYNVTQGQIDGPDWLMKGNQVFEVSAKLPEGAGEAQVPLMLQALLEDRFKAAIHRSTKQAMLYALTVGKDGPKFPRKDADPTPASRLDIDVNRAGGHIGGAKVSQEPNGTITVETSSPAGLLYMLSGLLEPVTVVDKTGMQGTFDIKLEIAPNVAVSLNAGPWDADDLAQMRRDNIAAGLSKLGLKLEQERGPVEMIVVDRMEMEPTEN